MIPAAGFPDPNNLGAATEALINHVFGSRLTISAKEAAKLLGMTPRVLRTMTDQGLIRAVRRGKVRAYIEADIRAYLADSPDRPPRTETRRPPPPARSRDVVAFSQRHGAPRPHDRL